MPYPYSGQLRANEIFAALFNMVISIDVNADNIADGFGSLVERARVDGGLYGDTKLYVETDVLRSHPWLGDAEAANLLAVDRPPMPAEQAIQLDQFYQIRVTVDEYLSKRAWIEEGSFSKFNGVVLGWLSVTKQVYDETTYNVFLGTHVTVVGQQIQTVSLAPTNAAATTGDEEAEARIRAQKAAQKIADLFIDMKSPTRDYNDLGFLRSYKASDLIVIFNSKYANEITKLDLPTIFHDEKVREGMFKEENILPEKYFGNINAAATAGDGSTVRSLIEQEITTGGVTHHYFAGDLILVGDTAPAGSSYTVDSKVICKIVQKLPPYMSAFQVGTSFFNARALLTNHYLTWGRNTLEHLAGKPFITIKEA